RVVRLALLLVGKALLVIRVCVLGEGGDRDQRAECEQDPGETHASSVRGSERIRRARPALIQACAVTVVDAAPTPSSTSASASPLAQTSCESSSSCFVAPLAATRDASSPVAASWNFSS